MCYHFSTRRIFHFGGKQNVFLKTEVIFPSFSTFSANKLFSGKSLPHIFPECSKKKAHKPGRQAHAQVIVSGFKPNVFIANCLLHMYLECSRFECAAKVFDRMPQRNCFSWNRMIFGYSINGEMGLAQSLFGSMPRRNVFSWTSLISGYLHNGNCMKSVEVFVMMGRDGVAYDETTISVVLKAIASLGNYVLGQQLHGIVVKLGFENDALTGNAMLSMYAKCQMLDESFRVFDAMPFKDCVSWSAIIAASVQNNKLKDGLKLFKKMLTERVEVTEHVYASVFKSCASLSYSRLGPQMHGHALTRNFGAVTIVSNSILDMYAKCNNLLNAVKVFDLLPNKNMESYNALMVGYARGGRGFEGMKLFLQLFKSDLGFDEISLSMAFSCCAASKELVLGTQIHGLVIKTPFHHNIRVVNVILDMYRKCGALPDAFHIC